MRTLSRSLLAVCVALMTALLTSCMQATLLPAPDWSRTTSATAPTKEPTAAMIHVFPNTMTLVHRRNPSNRIVSVVCLARPGATGDEALQAGRTHLMMRVLTKGTTSRTSDQIAEALEGMGVRLSAGENHDYASVSMQCVRDDLDEAMKIVADVMRNPVFPIEELRTERQKVLAAMRIRDDQTPSATMKAFRKALFGPGPYGRPVEGEPETVPLLTQTDLIEAHRAHFAPQNMVWCIVGDISFEDAIALVGTHFGDMEPGERPVAVAYASVLPRAGNEERVRDVEQGFVAMGSPTCPVGHADAAALDVAGAILGQGMSARLFRTLRDERGLAYMVGALNTRFRDGGYFGAYIGTSPEAVRASLQRSGERDPMLERGVLTEMDWAARALWREVEALALEPVPAEELDRAKAYLIGGYLRAHETNAGQAHYLAYWQLMGLGVDYDARYPEELRAVTSRDIMRVANKYFRNPASAITRPSRAARP